MQRLSGLDALRGIAAIVVVVYHLNYFAPGLVPHTNGNLAVDFFFMLSGYVMARTYEGRFEQIGAGRFLWLRFKRFAPTMGLGTLFGIPLLLPYTPDQQVQFVLFGLLLIPSFNSVLLFPLNVVAWSLFFELFANTLHSAALHRIRTALLVAALPALALSLGLAFHAFRSSDIGSLSNNFVGGIPRVLLSYIAGVVLFRLWRDTAPFRIPAIITIAALPLVAAFVSGPLLSLLAIMVVFPLLIAGGLSLNAGSWGSALGSLSFPVYAVHFPIMLVCQRWGIGPWEGVAVVALVVAALNSVNQTTIEVLRRRVSARLAS